MNMKSFLYYNDQSSITPSDDDTLVVNIPSCNSLDELLNYLSEYLYFPDYFGCNLDALWDCITILDNVPQKNIVIVHKGAINISCRDFELYILQMTDAINIWDLAIVHEPPFAGHSGYYSPEHYLDVAFPESMKMCIESIVKKQELSSMYIIDDYEKNLKDQKAYFGNQLSLKN